MKRDMGISVSFHYTPNDAHNQCKRLVIQYMLKFERNRYGKMNVWTSEWASEQWHE